MLFAVSMAMLTAAVIATPELLGRLLRPGQILHPQTINRLRLYQFVLITFAAILTSAFGVLLVKRHRALFLVAAFVAYSGIAYAAYVKPRYPDNVILSPAEYNSLWRVLTRGALLLEDYAPEPTLVVNRQHVTRARHPAIDIHFHLDSLVNVDADTLVRAMDACGIEKLVNMDGGAGQIERFTKEFSAKYPDRFVMFFRPNLRVVAEAERWQALGDDLAAAAGKGARGVKITKDLGLTLKDRQGRIVAVDDARLDPLWAKAAELQLPVLIHVSDAAPFFRPTDRFNERYEELKDFPEWSFHRPGLPTKEALRAQREQLLKRHPGTIFIGAHVGSDPEDLGYVSQLLRTYPNYYVDIASVVPELGRQPFTAREFFLTYQDRILYGTDGGFGIGETGWPIEKFFQSYFDFLETHNEYFEYPLWGINKQGRWRVYGIDLPDEALKKLYRANAAGLLHLEAAR